MMDASRKQRLSRRYGSANHATKLTHEMAEAIRASKLKKYEIAKQFGVGLTTIHEIRVGKRWVTTNQTNEKENQTHSNKETNQANARRHGPGQDRVDGKL